MRVHLTPGQQEGIRDPNTGESEQYSYKDLFTNMCSCRCGRDKKQVSPENFKYISKNLRLKYQIDEITNGLDCIILIQSLK